MAGEMRALAVGALVFLVLGAFVTLRMSVTTDITQFLPSSDAERDYTAARQLATGELSRTMVLLVGADSTADALRASRDFEVGLRADARVADAISFLDAGPPQNIEEAFWRIYGPRKFSFLADRAEAVPARLTDAALHRAAADLKEQLALPLSGLLSRVAPEDPTLVLPGLFKQLAGGRGEGLQVVDGRFVTADGKAAVLFVGTRAAAVDTDAQRPFLEAVREVFKRTVVATGLRLSLHESGMNRFAMRSESSIKADIERVSVGSLLGVLLFFGLLFGSPRLAIMVVPVLGAGFLSGTAACLWLFGSIHGLTLAFGAALIGVSVDYAVHFHCHHVLVRAHKSPRETLHGILRGLSLSGATTVVGFLALAISAFPGLREMAVFATAGIAGALLATVLLLPGLALDRPPTRLGLWILTRIEAALAGRHGQRRWLALPILVVAALAAVGLPSVRWNDSIAALNQVDPVLAAEDEAVQSRVTGYQKRRLVVALGADRQAALRVNDHVAEVLGVAERDGLIGGARTLATMLPSIERQQAVDAAVRSNSELWPRMRDALVKEDFRAEAFEPFRQALDEEPPPPLRYEDLMASPLSSLVRPFIVSMDDEFGVVSFVGELRDEERLRELLGEGEGARLVDIEAVLSGAYVSYRQRMIWLLSLGLMAVVGLVSLRHRALRPTLMALCPALLAAAGTVGILSLAGQQLNLLSLVALLMVVSMGVDYGVFLAETCARPNALRATHLSVFVAGVSTILGFGLLAFSDQPALFSIGSTAGLGVLLCLLLAPTTCTLLRPRTS